MASKGPTVEDRLAALETGIEFDTLPRRKILDLIEAEALLDPNVNLLPGIATPDRVFKNRAGCRVYNSANIAVGIGAVVALTFDSERWDDDNMHVAATPTRVTFVTPGRYMLTGHVLWGAAITGPLHLYFKVNGATTIGVQSMDHGGAAGYYQTVSTIWTFVAGDYVELVVFNQGGAATQITAAGALSPELSVTWAFS